MSFENALIPLLLEFSIWSPSPKFEDRTSMDYPQVKQFRHLVVRASQPGLIIASAIVLYRYSYRLGSPHSFHIHINLI
jgi:hypothetical protein